MLIEGIQCIQDVGSPGTRDPNPSQTKDPRDRNYRIHGLKLSEPRDSIGAHNIELDWRLAHASIQTNRSKSGKSWDLSESLPSVIRSAAYSMMKDSAAMKVSVRKHQPLEGCLKT